MGYRGPSASRLKLIKDETAIKAVPEAHVWQQKGLTRAERVIAFLETLPVTKGILAGTTMTLRPWQRDIIEAIYRTGDDGRRIVRTALITMPRKNGKTGLAAGLCLAHLLGPEAEPRAECYSAAADLTQAAIIFAEMEAIIEQTPWMFHRCGIKSFHRVIEDKITGSIYRSLSSDGRKAHGLSTSFFVYDELAQAPNRQLLDNLQTSTGGRAEPLGVIISTQAADDLHCMSQLVDYGRQVQQGIIGDPSFHATIYAAPEDADPWSEDTWRACNPALGDFRSLEEMQKSAEQARHMPAKESSFRNLYLNQRVSAEERFINAAEWDACNALVDITALAGRRCFGGLDLGSVRDLTALVLIFPDDAGCYDVLPFFWCPKDNLRLRADEDKVPYDVWARDGFIEPTPGAITDYAFVSHKLGELAARFHIEALAFDRWRIQELKLELARSGVEIKLVEFGQGYQSMSPAIDHLERAILDRKLRHGGNPILRWNASNAVVVRDPAGNCKLDKERSREKIDGLVALTMALGIAKKHKEVLLPSFMGGLEDLPLFNIV